MKKILLFTLMLFLLACKEDKPIQQTMTPIAIIPEEARDYFSHMSVLESGGDKGQIQLQDGDHATLWFESVQNLLTYLRLPETANRPMTAYVSIRDKQGNPEEPHKWMAVEKAVYLQLPPDAPHGETQQWQAYATQADAEALKQKNGGVVFTYSAITAEVLGVKP